MQMPLRRTIGISLAFLVVSAGAMGKTPDKTAPNQPVDAAKPGKLDLRATHIGSTCYSSRSRSSHRYSSRQRARATPDSYIPVRTIGKGETGNAAWYSLVGNYTSSGERLDMVTPTAAHRSLPLSSYARVTSLESGRSVVVKINDRGPQSRRFIIDLSPRAAEVIDMKRAGVAAVMVEPVILGPTDQPNPTVAAFQPAAFQTAQ